MSNADHQSRVDQDKYHLIFLHSIPRTVRGAHQTRELGTWLMSNRRNNYRPDMQQEPHP